MYPKSALSSVSGNAPAVHRNERPSFLGLQACKARATVLFGAAFAVINTVDPVEGDRRDKFF